MKYIFQENIEIYPKKSSFPASGKGQPMLPRQRCRKIPAGGTPEPQTIDDARFPGGTLFPPLRRRKTE